MKTKMLILCGSMLLISCVDKKKETSDEVLKDKIRRTEIMQNICSDTVMMNEMIVCMKDSDEAMELIQNDQELVCSVAKGSKMPYYMKKDSLLANHLLHHLMEIMEEDSAACIRLTGTMLGDGHMQSMLWDMMDENKLHQNKKRMMHRHFPK